MATPAFVASATGSASGTSVSVAKPAGTAEGDVIVVGLSAQGDVGITAPAGWTAIDAYTKGSSGGAPCTVGTFQKIAGASEPTSYTFTTSASVWKGIAACTFRPARSTPVDVYGENFGTSASSSVVAPSVTPTRTDSLLVCVFGVSRATTDGGTCSFTPPSGMTERADSASANAGVSVATLVLATTSATGTKTATSGTSGSWAAQSIVLSPTGAEIKFWDGAAWTAKPLKRWDGTTWVEVDTLKFWNGTAWTEV